MKTAKKSLAILLAVIMVLALGATAFADGTITVTPPTGNPSDATNTYKIYKVFDASGDGTGQNGKVSYKLVEGKTTVPTGFSADAQGNVTYTGTGTELSDTEIASIAAYVQGDSPVATIESNGTAKAVSESLPAGYYYITTSTGTAVTINTNNGNIEVDDKNTPPTITKEITGVDQGYGAYDDDGKKAIAQVGKDVEFTVDIAVKEGAVNYKLLDTLTGLVYKADSLKVTVDSATISAGSTTYSVSASGSSITVNFANDWIKNQAGKTVKVTYKGTVTKEALSTDPAKNTAKLQYGSDPQKPYETPEEKTEVYNARITVTKKIGSESGNPLANAGFVLKNSSNQYYKKSGNAVSWYTLGSNETLAAAIAAGKVTEYKSNASGAVQAFTGLANGTYKLEESTVPAGYNKAPDKEVTINGGDYTAANLELTPTVVNQAGTVLPSTGGVGTTIFYVLGSCLLLGAAVLMITRKRMSKEG